MSFVLKEVCDEFLTCNICLEPFKEPKQLPCLHTFCRICLHHYIRSKVCPLSQRSEFPCPLCRSSVTAPRPSCVDPEAWASSFPDNFFVDQLTTKVQAHLGDLMPDCDSDWPEEETRYVLCPHHPERRLAAFCTRYQTGVCDACALDVHIDCLGDHRGQSESRELAEQRIRETTERFGELQIKLESVKDILKSRARDTRRRKEEIESCVANYFRDTLAELANMIDKKEKEISDHLLSLVAKDDAALLVLNKDLASLSKNVAVVVEEMTGTYDHLKERSVVGSLTLVESSATKCESYMNTAEEIRRQAIEHALVNVTEDAAKRALSDLHLRAVVDRVSTLDVRDIDFIHSRAKDVKGKASESRARAGPKQKVKRTSAILEMKEKSKSGQTHDIFKPPKPLNLKMELPKSISLCAGEENLITFADSDEDRTPFYLKATALSPTQSDNNVQRRNSAPLTNQAESREPFSPDPDFVAYVGSAPGSQSRSPSRTKPPLRSTDAFPFAEGGAMGGAPRRQSYPDYVAEAGEDGENDFRPSGRSPSSQVVSPSPACLECCRVRSINTIPYGEAVGIRV